MNASKGPLIVTNKSILTDPALKVGARGARKIAVTTLYKDNEHPYEEPYWFGSNSSTPVMVMEDTEFAVFTEETVQDCHYHTLAHEFYTVLKGQFTIQIDDACYTLNAGETVVVPPYAVHQIFRDTPFTAQVIVTHCGGVEDKFVSPANSK